MKLPKITYALLGFMYAFATGSVANTNPRFGALPYREEEKQVSIESMKPGDNGPLSWVKNGSVKRVWLGEPKEYLYIYRVRGGGPIFVSGSIYSLQRVLAMELTASPELKPIVYSRLPEMIFELMAHRDSRMIDRGYALEYLSRLKDFPPEARSVQRKRTAERLSECAACSFFKSEGSGWNLTFYATDTTGALSKWQASGEDDPFCVNEFRITRVEGPDTLEPYVPMW